MRRQRGRHERAPQASRSRARRVARVALFAMPVAVIAILAMNVAGTRSQLEASITNDNNNVSTERVGLGEGPNNECGAEGGGITTCDVIDKFGGGNVSPGMPVTVRVSLQNTGNVPADLFVRPSRCSDSLTGADGALCSQVTVNVTCGTAHVTGPVTLTVFRNNRPAAPANGYPAGTLAPSATTTCEFTLTALAPMSAGTVSQPIAMILTGV